MSENGPFSHDELEAFASHLRRVFNAPPDEDVRAAHLAAMSAEVPDAAPASAARGRRVRGIGVRGAVAAAGLVLVGGSVLAATGTLPAPVQDVIADAVDGVVDIPGGHEPGRGTPSNPIAAQNKAEAVAFTTAKKAWLDCMKADASPTPTPAEGADPVATSSACGEKPHPHDFRSEKTAKPDRTPKARPERTDKPERTPPVVRGDDGVLNPGRGRVDKTPRPTRSPKPARTAEPTETPTSAPESPLTP